MCAAPSPFGADTSRCHQYLGGPVLRRCTFGLPKSCEIVIYGSGADHEDALKVASVINSSDRQIRIMRGGVARWLELNLQLVRPRQEADRIATF